MDWQAIFNSWQVQGLLRLLVAATLGALVGLEREHHGRSAGFRTQMLVALGSALVRVVSLNFGLTYGNESANTAFRVDPARLAYGVMTGIGFLGAGAIMRQGLNVQGMTTAASLWCTAAMGLACGFGLYILAAGACALVLFALLLLNRVDKLIPVAWYRTFVVTVQGDKMENVLRLRRCLESCGMEVLDIQYAKDISACIETITYHTRTSSRIRIPRYDCLNTEPGVIKVEVR